MRLTLLAGTFVLFLFALLRFLSGSTQQPPPITDEERPPIIVRGG